MWDTKHPTQPLATAPERGGGSPLLTAAMRVATAVRVSGTQTLVDVIHGDGAEYATVEVTLASDNVVGVTTTMALEYADDRPTSPGEVLADLAFRAVIGDLDALASLLMLVGFDYTAYLRRLASDGS